MKLEYSGIVVLLQWICIIRLLCKKRETQSVRLIQWTHTHTHTNSHSHKRKQWPKGGEPGHSKVWQMSLWRLYQHPSLWATTPQRNLWPLWAHTVITTSTAMSKHRGQEPSFDTHSRQPPNSAWIVRVFRGSDKLHMTTSSTASQKWSLLLFISISLLLTDTNKALCIQ